MKPTNSAYIIILILLGGCAIFNPELKYTPKNSAEYYFPPLREEVKQQQAECVRLKNSPFFFSHNDWSNGKTIIQKNTNFAKRKQGQGRLVPPQELCSTSTIKPLTQRTLLPFSEQIKTWDNQHLF